jgi:hypothetical protein
MATYIFDIENQNVNSNPISAGNWIQRPSTSSQRSWGTSIIEAATTPVGTKQWKLVAGGGGTGMHTFLEWLVPDAANDIEVLTLLKRSTLEINMGPLLRVGGQETDNISGYFVGIRNNASEVRSRIWTTTLRNNNLEVQHDFDETVDTWFWIKGSVVGTAIKLRVWEEGTPEPTDWGLEFTDSTHTNGGVGLGDFARTDDIQLVAWFSVGTGSDKAPTPYEDTGLAFIGEPPRVISRTTTSYTIGGTLSEEGDVFAVAILPEATDPTTPTQIIAGTDGSGTDARGTGQQLGVTSFSIDITGDNLSDNPTHDIFVVGRKQT